ncbi:uncharacterized protein CIMG_10949 [Coccidioides immitis RS]|uniref:Uncharacterized protein n=3 Tax=Coccidioides immitis TaxID=5501 RepID=A0A0D8JSQ8_COCIM|nr:uncharacterized protein CIMG_10949 [Coccidioides immitis RS]KJF60016.1 hypothetical protein CIMG_10949 [Coccidioides immitis RS]KMP10001.1 hypothetical protein CIRG_09234 [Coccidioides immitis RMSCC 2394]KMU81107.1 hypothetical protein CISG_02485 [Coccidioides immitis RMSCC 3703]
MEALSTLMGIMLSNLEAFSSSRACQLVQTRHHSSPGVVYNLNSAGFIFGRLSWADKQRQGQPLLDAVELLQAAIPFSFIQTFPDCHVPLIFSERHGRGSWDDFIDLTCTAGWFTTLLPVEVLVDKSGDLKTMVRVVKEVRRGAAKNWVAGGIDMMEIGFNFAGLFQHIESPDSLFRLKPMSSQSLFDGAEELLVAGDKIQLFALGGRLQFHFTLPRGLNQARDLDPCVGHLKKCQDILTNEYQAV